ncbi:hypothetical protein WQ54_13275 [Bacillus sp. SA1-12]|uniref:histidine phosphatase family protein n=1 Tax=Bacillus sp. SA1-12 TaxID=1455638 RepID=UPI000625C143|nr:histidine phosphatase family protein [Bacillus sp. SA1-12]KKI91687.1 hypothetical protein WQ54_13275 [Bacillus sp. SA1-12]
MLTIYLVRHGETQWNTEKRLQGWKDSPLTDKGIKNAQLLGKRLSKIEFNAFYSSPIKRALQTAEYIRLGRDIPILTDENLKEINFGEWEGKTRKELKEKYEKEFSNLWNSPHKFDHKSIKGEGLTDFRERIEKALKRIITENPNGNILVLTHAIAIQAILSNILKYPTEKIWDHPFIHNVGLTVISWDGNRFQIEMLNDTTHLKDNN